MLHMAPRDRVPTATGSVSLHRGHYVYRFYGPNEQLLYVGVTSNLHSRLGSHLSSAPWADDAERIEWEEWPTRYAAEIAEGEQIATLRPLHNVTLRIDVRPIALDPVAYGDLPDHEKQRQAVVAHRRLALGEAI